MRVEKYLSRLSGFWSWIRRQILGYRARHAAHVKYEKLNKSESETVKNDTRDGSRVSYLQLVSIYRKLHEYSKSLDHLCPFWNSSSIVTLLDGIYS